ncbi:MAG: hypothetical protein AAF487_10165 [Bacteroidota bacterium]
MLRKFYISLVVLLFSTFAWAQTPTITVEAAKLYEQKELQRAKEKIDAAILTEQGKVDSYTWHVRGHIYKEIYKVIDNRDPNSKNREESVEAFFKAMEFDADGKFDQMNYNVIKTFFIPSFYNDVVNMLNNRTSENIDMIKPRYDKYREVQKRLEPDFSLSTRDINFAKALATSYRKLIEIERNNGSEREEYEAYFEAVKEYYRAAIKLDTMDYGANYNLAINLYNEAAYIIENIGPDCDLHCIGEKQEICVDLFKEALPFALTAYKLKPERVEINKALRAIYYSLILEDKKEDFESNLRELKKGRTLDGIEFQEWKLKFERKALNIHKKCIKDLPKDIEGVNSSIEGDDIFERLGTDGIDNLNGSKD